MFNRVVVSAASLACFVSLASLLSVNATAQTAAATAVKPPSDGQPHHLRYTVFQPERKLPKLTADPGLGDVAVQTCKLRREVMGPLIRLLTAAREKERQLGDGWQLEALSCYRNRSYQAALFCHQSKVPLEQRRLGVKCVDPKERAKVSAPPDRSEHGTGFALDFTVVSAPGSNLAQVDCGDEGAPCRKQMDTDIGKWLIANAASFGFEMSFAGDRCDGIRNTNEQGVSYEPWHWRWVGIGPNDRTAAEARRTFKRAREWYPYLPNRAVADCSTTPSAVN